MRENMSRRDFLEAALLAAEKVIERKIPSWIYEVEKDELFKEFVGICAEILEEDELLDLLGSDDLEEALGLVFTLLLTKGIEPEEYLIMQDFLQ
jgi:hypothetical protein